MVAIKMSMAMQRFRAAKSPEEEKCVLGEATPGLIIQSGQ